MAEEPKENKKRQVETPIAICIIIGCILIIAIVSILIVRHNLDKRMEDSMIAQTEGVQENGEFVKVENGVRTNTSDAFSKTRQLDGLEISNIQLTERDGVSVILADVKNTTDKENGNFGVNIKVLNKEGSEIISISGFIDKVEPGQTVQLNTSATADFANAYDFEITKE